MRLLPIILALTAACYGREPGSPLIGAARTGDVRTIRTLAARGADMNEHGGVNDWTALENAVHKDQIESVKALLDGGADPNRTDPNGLTPLMMAAGYGYTPIVKVLLARGADTRLRDGKGSTALDYAIDGTADIDRTTIFDCQNETIKVLRDAGAPSAKTSAFLARFKRC